MLWRSGGELRERHKSCLVTPDRDRHRPVTRTSGYGNVTGQKYRTPPRPVVTRGSLLPVSITSGGRAGRTLKEGPFIGPQT
jgi:hypothetical protein